MLGNKTDDHPDCPASPSEAFEICTWNVTALWDKLLLSSHLSLNREGRWGTKSRPVSSSFFALHYPPGLGELQACSFLDDVFPPLPLSALSSFPFHCALQDAFGQT